MTTRYFFSTTIIAALTLLAACSTLFTATPTGVTTTNQVTRVTTNTATGTTSTNTTERVTTQMVYAVSQPVTTALTTAESTATFLPPPYSTAATALLALTSGVLGLIVQRKNKQNLDLTATAAAAASVVRAVETVASQPAFAALKPAIAAAIPPSQTTAAHALVQSVTA